MLNGETMFIRFYGKVLQFYNCRKSGCKVNLNLNNGPGSGGLSALEKLMAAFAVAMNL